jgi:drug/metabolite transporter (DMT)-like permease
MNNLNLGNQKKSNFIKNPYVVALLALFCCALWGSAFPCVKLGYEWFHIEDAASQILFAGYRFTLAGILTLICGCVMERRLLTIPRSAILSVLFLGLCQTTLQYVFFYLGLAHTTGSKGSVINATNVFFSIIIAHFVISSERLTLKKLSGCILGFIGIIVLNLSSGGYTGGFHFYGEGFLLISAFIYGASSVMVKFISQKGNPVAITAYQLIFGGIILSIIGKSTGGNLSPSGAKSYLLFGYMVLLSAVAFTIWTILLRYNPVGKVAIFGFSNPVFGIILSGIILHENFLSSKNIIALILVCIGIVVVNLDTADKA